MFPPTGFGGFGKGFSPEEIRKQFSVKLLIKLVDYIASFNKKKKLKDIHKGRGIPVSDGSKITELMKKMQEEYNVNRTSS